jgi:hypothetical protein
MTKEFRFEHTHRLSQAEVTELFSPLPQDPVRRWINRLGLTALGVACLFSSYTVLIGIALLGLGAFVLVAPRFVPFTAKRTYRKLLYLHDPLTYGMNQQRLWIRGPDLQADAAWRHLATWSETRQWFVLSVNHLPKLYFPLAALRDAGVYDDVRACAGAHAPEFNSPEAKRAAL